ncbi:coiled-coil domain-containing protein [Cloacibacterium normanense]|uniref:coiled-coil domain-containing protein n=1 Tax=Cloacibacterium normanense TaxID=237258 RepID=UPI0035B09A0D
MKFRELKTENSTLLDKMADSVISWIGSTSSLVFHTLLFITSFLLPLFKVIEFEEMLLVLTTIVSLEAIYLSIFIQMSVNKSNKHIEVIKEDVNEIQEDIDEIQEDIDEIQEDIDEIQEDIDEIADDEDEDEHKEKAQKVILKSNVSNNKQEIKELKAKIHDLQSKLEELIQKDFN